MVNNVQYSIANSEALAKVARERASQNARNKAEQLAELAGVELGEVVMVSDGLSFVGATNPMFVPACTADVGLASGRLSVNASVQVRFTITKAGE